MADDVCPDDPGIREQVSEWVRVDFGLRLGRLEQVRGGADAAAVVWRGSTLDGRVFAVKWTAGGTSAGLVVPAELAARGISGVLTPIPARSGDLWTTRGGRRLSVSPWVDDPSGMEAAMTAAHWRSYGRLLADVHAATVTDAIGALTPYEEFDHRHWAAELRAVHERVSAASTVAPVDRPDQVVAALVDAWSEGGAAIPALMALADSSRARALAGPPARCVVCHADPHVGNLLVGQSGAVTLIDWDDAMLAPIERDLMFVYGGVLAFDMVDRERRGWFRDGYGEVAVDPVRLTYYRCVRAMEDLAVPAADVLDVTRDAAFRRRALATVCDVLGPSGLVAQALGGPGWEPSSAG